jgi:hypothetical protein
MHVDDTETCQSVYLRSEDIESFSIRPISLEIENDGFEWLQY